MTLGYLLLWAKQTTAEANMPSHDGGASQRVSAREPPRALLQAAIQPPPGNWTWSCKIFFFATQTFGGEWMLQAVSRQLFRSIE